MNKNVLIVTGSDYNPCVYDGFEKAKSLGLKLYLLSDGSFEPRPGFFEDHYRYDLRKTREVLDYMDSQPVHFDAVTIKTSEWLTPLTALLAKHYGCIGNEPLTAFRCRSKYHMRKALEKGGVPIPKFRLCKNYEDLLTAVREIGIPCVMKPVGGNASYGTFMIQHEEDLKNLKEKYELSIRYLQQKAVSEDVFAFNAEEMDLIGVDEHVDMVTDYLVEEYMVGPEISVDALVHQGEITPMAIEDQIRMAPPYFLQIAGRVPFQCDETRQKEIEDILGKTIRAMSIQNSATHTEIIFTPTGLKIVEIGCRIGGDDLHETIWEVTGYNLMFESIMIALGEKRTYDVKPLCHTMMKFILPAKAGVIQSIHVPQELETDEHIFTIDLLLKPGDRVGTPPENFDYIGYVSAKGATAEEADARATEALNKIEIHIE